MIPARMTCVRLTAAGVALLLACGGALSACGSPNIKLAHANPDYGGAQLFSEHCSGCHTLDVVAAEGSATKIRDRLRNNGPNFNQRKEQPDQVLYAIRNGGFSGAIMPQNLVVGVDAQAIASFLSKYSGLKAKSPKGPNSGSSQGNVGQSTPGGASPSGGSGSGAAGGAGPSGGPASPGSGGAGAPGSSGR